MASELILDDKDWVVFPADEQKELQYEDIEEDAMNLLDGEEKYFERSASINFTQMNLKTKGIFLITNFRLCFLYSPQDQKTEGHSITQSVLTCENTSIPLTAISNIVSSDGNKSIYSNLIITQPINPELEIKTKDFRILRFHFDNIKDRDEALNVLTEHVFFGPSNIQATFAFIYGKATLRRNLPKKREWIYSIEDEFHRLCFPSDKFEVSSLNSNFELCPTYPKKFIHPIGVLENDVKESASFRSHRRFPVVVWIHSTTKATISRCSQPKVGIRRARSEADERLVKAIFSSNPCYKEKKMYIIDCRPKLLASANVFRGAGFEAAGYYENCKIEFMNLDNIHSIRSSYQAMMNVCCNRETPDRIALETTKWLEYIKTLLTAAIKMSRLLVEEGVSIVTHCSDGWDRTTQLVALVELLLDPYYRTLCGFCVLIQKEWLSFGHKFRDRVGHGVSEESSSEFSPIFLQWIDAVYQVMCQYPNYFEFNEYFLIVLLDNVINCRFGTFLTNCEQEYNSLQIEEKTANFWDWIFRPRFNCQFMNPDYIHKTEPLIPEDLTSRLQFWAAYYTRYRIEAKQYLEHLTVTRQARTRGMNRLYSENLQLKQRLKEEEKKIELYEYLIFEQLKDRDDFQAFLKKELQKPRDKRERDSFECRVYRQGKDLVLCISSKQSDNKDTTTSNSCQRESSSQQFHLQKERPVVQCLYSNLDDVTIDNYFQETEIFNSDKPTKSKTLLSLISNNDKFLQTTKVEIVPSHSEDVGIATQKLVISNSMTNSLFQSLLDVPTSYVFSITLSFSRIVSWFRDQLKTEQQYPQSPNSTCQSPDTVGKRENEGKNEDQDTLDLNDFEPIQITETISNNNNDSINIMQKK